MLDQLKMERPEFGYLKIVSVLINQLGHPHQNNFFITQTQQDVYWFVDIEIINKSEIFYTTGSFLLDCSEERNRTGQSSSGQ